MRAPWLPRGLAALLSATVSLSSACSNSNANSNVTDAEAPDARPDGQAIDVLAEGPDAPADVDLADADVDLADAVEAAADAVDEAADAVDEAADALAGGDEMCVQLCSFRIAAACDIEDPACVSKCERDLASGVCYAEARRTQVCIIAIGTGAFTCVNGRASFKPEVCPEEKAAVATCLLATQDAGTGD